MARSRIPWRTVPGTEELARRFGNRVRELRRARGLSRDNLATLVGIKPAGLARLERGERFNAANLAPLANALNCEVRDLFDFGGAAVDEQTRRIIDLVRGATPDQLALAERLLRAALSK